MDCVTFNPTWGNVSKGFLLVNGICMVKFTSISTSIYTNLQDTETIFILYITSRKIAWLPLTLHSNFLHPKSLQIKCFIFLLYRLELQLVSQICSHHDFPFINSNWWTVVATRLICWLCILHAKYKYILFPHVRVVPDKESDIYNDLLGEKKVPRFLGITLMWILTTQDSQEFVPGLKNDLYLGCILSGVPII